MRRPPVARRVALAGLAGIIIAAIWTLPENGRAQASTPAATIYGEGGDAMGPVMEKLLHDDASGLDPDTGSYTNVDLDQGISDFVGTAPGTFAADFAVSERPLTTAEASTAASNGRAFAYVPFAASPVALVTLVPNSTYTGSQTITPAQYCQHIPLSLSQLDGIYGTVSPPYSTWGDNRLSCTSPPDTPADAVHFGRWANLDPTMENFALMSLLDSTPASEAAFGAALTTAQGEGQAATSDPAASEHWPYSGTAITGGDQATLGKLIGLDPRTGAPSSVASLLTLGAIMPVTSVWTGDPLGVTWDLPTAAVQNAAMQYVAPSAAAAEAAESDATLDPTTNVVTFNANASDPTAYNNYLMLQSYLVVPTNGLPADKALALAQFIRFAVGGTGQADIASLGAAPATTAMVKADLAVAQELNAEAASATSTSSTTTTTTAGTSTSTTVATSSTTGSGASSSSATGNTGSASTAASTSGGLALTGSDPVPLVGLGLAFLVCGELARQMLRRRRNRT